MENKKNTDEKLNRSEKNGAFQQSIISEQIKKRPINKYRLLRRTLMTALLAIVFGIIASVTIWILEPVLSKWISRSDQSQGRDAVHFIDTGDDISAQVVLQDYMEQDQRAREAWDELEKSVVTHVADEIKVFIRGGQTEMTIIKKLG